MERDYTIFPTTWKARVILALGFLGGAAIFGAQALFFVFAWELPDLEEAPCYGPQRAECLPAQSELRSLASSSCDGREQRVCLVPIGNVSPSLVVHLVDHYERQYGLEVIVLTPIAVPADLPDMRGEQIEVDVLIQYMFSRFPESYGHVLIGITPLDIYIRDVNWRFAFGVRGTPADRVGLVSTFRMDPQTFGEPKNDELFFSRVRKMVSKYIGVLYYDLPTSNDADSPMYDSILGVYDLDGMTEPLPVSR